MHRPALSSKAHSLIKSNKYKQIDREEPNTKFLIKSFTDGQTTLPERSNTVRLGQNKLVLVDCSHNTSPYFQNLLTYRKWIKIIYIFCFVGIFTYVILDMIIFAQQKRYFHFILILVLIIQAFSSS